MHPSILLRPDGTVCDHAELSRRFGFPVPADFVRVADFIWRHSTPEALDETFYAVLGVFPRAAEARYPSTPPELFPFGGTGCDGVHHGYVIHAPELPAHDYPVGSYCPMDSGGVLFQGSGTLDAFEAAMSFILSTTIDELDDLQANEDILDEDEDREEIEQERAKINQTKDLIATLARAFDLAPAAAKSGRQYGPDGNGVPVRPVVPPGWRHVLSSDWVGVLAPASAFRNDAGPSVNRNTPPDDVLATASAALDAGFPATALLELREAFWLHGPARRYASLLADAYEGLCRPILADITRQRSLK